MRSYSWMNEGAAPDEMVASRVVKLRDSGASFVIFAISPILAVISPLALFRLTGKSSRRLISGEASKASICSSLPVTCGEMVRVRAALSVTMSGASCAFALVTSKARDLPLSMTISSWLSVMVTRPESAVTGGWSAR